MQTTTDSRIDDYISNAAPFAKPILVHLRALVHQACPEATETIKWGMPFFEYKGMLCNMAAFKQHCAFGFYKAKLMSNAADLQSGNETAMGHLGKITSLEALPPDEVVLASIREAAALNEAGVKKVTTEKKAPRGELAIPGEILDALAKDEKAKNYFSHFSYSQKKEYVEWILDAKTATTRERRLATMLEWLQEGKGRNWKYEQK